MNAEELAKILMSTYRQSPAKLEMFIKYLTYTADFTDTDRAQILQGIQFESRLGQHDQLKKMLLHGEDSALEAKDWHLKRLRSKTVHPVDLACANTEVDSILVHNKPVIFFWAARDIQPGEQLGYDYSFGYWADAGRMPRIFDKQGKTIPKSAYMYTEMAMGVKTQQTKLCYFYNEQLYQRTLLMQQPVKFSPASLPVSFFKLREQLVANNVIPQNHQACTELNCFARDLKAYLSSDFTIKLFERNPGAQSITERYIFDVVCTASSLVAWQDLRHKLQHSVIKTHSVYLEATQEIIIKDVNLYAIEMQNFIKANSMLTLRY